MSKERDVFVAPKIAKMSLLEKMRPAADLHLERRYPYTIGDRTKITKTACRWHLSGTVCT